ncbi:MAG: hypothetical protein A2X67_08210 [Ignavibacteria bacterium GWA2_55_11]|nr:MAG: hypothetical protein A2X67_08210 [Ignavibacteria bacterium GWA2_55_11]OGU46831.1 MAG: hypothetical protein A2X68_03125 [Ignavibacteria bacterium GWC2_56_12]OGU69761.1 MAG: hypothetical protein A3H45_11930 [Ignavibacteria bacterium RIFCSPLOWO2_02_FULL_55_14]OGU75911.1 MAG: hypothetical protein A3G43_08945 [Ignavibacteria bacterium RIFCSPLOWO2_12_FULL_56_21]HAV23279.1 hypothetical protein [Bacteroidota bacterium]
MTADSTEQNTPQPAADTEGFHVMEHLAFVVKRKELLVATFLVSLALCYGAIYVFVEEQFEASATIVPREDFGLDGFGGMLKSIKGLPLDLGSKSVGTEIDLYKTIIYSRTMMEGVIIEFKLHEVYGLDTTDVAYMEKAIKRLRDEILTKETEESAFLVTVRANSRHRAADMANFVVRKMNSMIVSLKASSSRESRMFLEKRVAEIRTQLRASEDSLRAYQEKTGLLDTKAQLEGILSAHTMLESELTAKELQKGILERAFDRESPQVKEVEGQIEEYRKKLKEMRTQGDPGGPMIALHKLPETAVEYLRRYREVEIGSLLLEYIMPLYEQAKIEEKKDYPILQVIDYAVPPVKKSYPPRAIFSLVGALSVTVLVLIALNVQRSFRESRDPYWRTLLDEARHWTWDPKKK